MSTPSTVRTWNLIFHLLCIARSIPQQLVIIDLRFVVVGTHARYFRPVEISLTVQRQPLPPTRMLESGLLKGCTVSSHEVSCAFRGPSLHARHQTLFDGSSSQSTQLSTVYRSWLDEWITLDTDLPTLLSGWRSELLQIRPLLLLL